MENFKDKNQELVTDIHNFLIRQLNDATLVNKEFLIFDKEYRKKSGVFVKQ